MAQPGDSSDFVDKAEAIDIGMDGIRNARAGRGRGSGRGGRGGRGGGGSGGMNRDVAISKALSKLLRHAAEEEGVKLDAEGFASVEQVLKWQRLKSLQVTFSDIKEAVADNAKQRFSMKPNPTLKSAPDLASEDPSDWVIRANQGHSIAIESAALLTPITLEAGNVPDIVVHGTYFAFYTNIVESGGLKKMTRNHIHFSTGLPEDRQGVISGMRSDAEILIYVDIRKSLEDGIIWWLSDNGVVLTEGNEGGFLETKYWQKVAGRKQDVGLLWEDGKKIASLPPALQNRNAPRGKGQQGKKQNGQRRDKAAPGGKGKDIPGNVAGGSNEPAKS